MPPTAYGMGPNSAAVNCATTTPHMNYQQLMVATINAVTAGGGGAGAGAGAGGCTESSSAGGADMCGLNSVYASEYF